MKGTWNLTGPEGKTWFQKICSSRWLWIDLVSIVKVLWHICSHSLWNLGMDWGYTCLTDSQPEYRIQDRDHTCFAHCYTPFLGTVTEHSWHQKQHWLNEWSSSSRVCALETDETLCSWLLLPFRSLLTLLCKFTLGYSYSSTWHTKTSLNPISSCSPCSSWDIQQLWIIPQTTYSERVQS
jgi:hypothetical protein